MPQPVVQMRAVEKRFEASGRGLMLSPRVRAFMGGGSAQRRIALTGLDLEVEAGEWLGIVGPNGAGKSTLLRVMAGLYRPTAGTSTVRGSVALLSGLGSGMIPQLDVRDNAFLYGSIYGLPRNCVRELMPEILAWAGLEEFEHERLQNLSSGMRTRLAFSIMRYFESDILLFDEALAAGDQSFRDKCYEHFEQLRSKPVTVVVATHNTAFAAQFCGRVLWMHEGRAHRIGATNEVLEAYRASS